MNFALSKAIDAQYITVWKETRNLAAAGLLLSGTNGRLKPFWLNPKCPILPELRALILKTVAAGDYIRQFLGELDGVQATFI